MTSTRERYEKARTDILNATAQDRSQLPTVVLDLGDEANVDRYVDLTVRLYIVRASRGDSDSHEEDEVLNLLDEAWSAMSSEEVDRLERKLVQMRNQFTSGDRVRTVRPEKESTDWTPEALLTRQWDVEGTIDMSHDSHGVTYEVRHADGTLGHYEPRELVKVTSVVDAEDPAQVG